ncbi:MAG: AMP-binding protein [Calditrichaeota bacterium]|nr:AMP-binding protein [Calditrichota bacterium]
MEQKTAKQLILLKNKISAGELSFTSDELQTLMDEFHEVLQKISSENRLQGNREVIIELTELLERLFHSGLAGKFSAAIDTELFRTLGEQLKSANQAESNELNKLIHYYLELFRQPGFLRRLKDVKPWEKPVLDLIKKSNFTVAHLLRLRSNLYSDKTLFGVIKGQTVIKYNHQTVRELVDRYARGLIALSGIKPHTNPDVAFLTENSLEMALLDLACLASGLVNVMIPANSVSSQIAFILNQTKVKILLVSGHKQLARVNEVRKELTSLEHIVMVNDQVQNNDVMSLDELVQMGMNIGDDQLIERRSTIRINDLATVMYTSGTTGEPKGIMFSQLSIIYKRFCRAMALPEIGPEDRFLAYLPLYHTFGRYLEMMGALFWSAEYYFMENPAVETMVRNMQLVRPTIFISIPKKWMQLYEYVKERVDVEIEKESIIKETVEEATGGSLKWGLSAAGYLDPVIFRFFQRYGIELLSGFGMTEATGGITMTEPGNYVENALGKPLPGIEVKLGEDGEMLIRGAYVMMGYYGESEQPFIDNWLPTGDIMRRMKNGYFEIIDRKKEIYKNNRGETIAPQRIENFFYDFDYVKQVFLVGDNRPFNTVLIYPNYEGSGNPLLKMDEHELHAFFSSVVVTVNNFLAPFERIVDFRIIDRPFSSEHGELTPKGTYKRRVIESNFAELIETMYQRNYVEFKWRNLTIRIPNWFLREKGYLIRDIRMVKDGIVIHKSGQRLPLKLLKDHRIQIGRYLYSYLGDVIDMQILLSNPLYWLGNKELIDFTGDQTFQWYRLERLDKNLIFEKNMIPESVSPDESRLFEQIEVRKEKSLKGIDLAVRHLQTDDSESIAKGVGYLRQFLDEPQQMFYTLVKDVVSHPGFVNSLEALKQQFRLGMNQFKGSAFQDYFDRFLKANPEFLTNEIIEEIADEMGTDTEVMKAIHSLIKSRLNALDPRISVKTTELPKLLELLAQIGVVHPIYYKQIRQWIVRYQLRKDCKDLSQAASKARRKLLTGFRRWIGENQKISVDVETGKEYRWKDVIIFEEDIPFEDKELLLKAISEKPIIREALFLFGEGMLVGLYDIPPGGVWISRLHEESDHSVYRVSVQTRFQGGYDFAINLERGKTTPAMLEEMNWLIHACAPARGIKLVEEFGGYWRELNLWTEEYIPGDSLETYFSKTMRRKDRETVQRLRILWPHFIWTGISAHVSFWRRTGYHLEIEDKSPSNIMIPPHDYHTGVRIFSIRRRKLSDGLPSLIMSFIEQFVQPLEEEYPFIKHDNFWYFVFSGILDAEGEEKGLLHLQQIQELSEGKESYGELQRHLKKYLRKIQQEGFIPRNLYFAIQRFERWSELNPHADFSAQLFTLNELFETYQLSQFESRYPEVRIRFFLETVFKDSQPDIRQKMLEIVKIIHHYSISHEQRLQLFSEIRNRFILSEKEDFFLSRLSYPHLQPEDSAGWLSATVSSGMQQSDVVVTLEDYDGRRYHVRKPISPKEISRLHKIFLDANLPVVFKPDHRFLIAVSERGYVIGGLFYSLINMETVHMEKIVVTQKYRRKGISEGLMREFFNRMHDAKFRYVTTGFFRPEYFYRFGFRIERKYAGLVKDLQAD